MRHLTRILSGWGNYPREECRLFRPERRRELDACLRLEEASGMIPRGLGRSYGDAALNGGGAVLLQEKLDRFLAFDAESGIVEVEGGVTFAALFNELIPKGWLLPTTPGTKWVTVGGAIAVDAHGKNHHRDGSLVEHVVDFQLVTPRGETLLCSRESNADVFWATCGGMGLTGVLVSARLRLERVETGYATVSYHKTNHLDETLGLLSESAERFRYSVAWLDGFSSGASLGRSVLMLGNLAPRDALPVGRRPSALTLRRPSTAPIPFEIPGGIPRPAVRLFNSLYYAVKPRHAERIVDLESYFYPLDRLDHWNRLYGRYGFSQFQAVFPFEHSREAIIETLETIQRARRAPYLAVLKTMGSQNPALLSFPRPGFTLALDLARVDEELKRLLRTLTELTLRFGGRLYLAKDAVLEPLAFHTMYPEAPRFRAVQRRLDPQARFRSSLSRRVGLLEE